MVLLATSETTACLGGSITFNCSANSNPAVDTYRLYVNGIMVNETSTTGVWNRIMTTRGEFVYNCMVNNSVGTAMSTNVTITVNGNEVTFSRLILWSTVHTVLVIS